MTTPATPTEPELPVADEWDVGDHSGTATRPAATVPPPPPPPSTPTKYTHSARHVGMARALGFSREELDTTPPTELGAELDRLMRFRELERAVSTPDRAALPVAPVAPPPKPDFEFDHEIVDPTTGVKRKAVEEDYDPGLLKIIKDQKRQLDELKGIAGTLQEGEKRRNQQSLAETFDAAFAALGEPFEKVFGKLTSEEMEEEHQPLMQRRLALIKAAGIDWSKDGPKVIAKKIKDQAIMLYGPMLESAPVGAGAYGAVVPGAVEPPAPAKPLPERRPDGTFKKTKAEEWEESQLQKPSQRNGAAEPKGDARAEKKLREKMVEMGMDPGPARNRELENELPD